MIKNYGVKTHLVAYIVLFIALVMVHTTGYACIDCSGWCTGDSTSEKGCASIDNKETCMNHVKKGNDWMGFTEYSNCIWSNGECQKCCNTCKAPNKGQRMKGTPTKLQKPLGIPNKKAGNGFKINNQPAGKTKR